MSKPILVIHEAVHSTPAMQRLSLRCWTLLLACNMAIGVLAEARCQGHMKQPADVLQTITDLGSDSYGASSEPQFKS